MTLTVLLLHIVTVDAVSPISLTTTDGQLDLVKMASVSAVSYPLSLTELRLTFKNPKNKVIEGRFEVVLPIGASVARFAMQIGNEWREGEVVERKFARKVYENFLLKKQDPALLELAAGNLFSARIFPVCTTSHVLLTFARTLLCVRCLRVAFALLVHVQLSSIFNL